MTRRILLAVLATSTLLASACSHAPPRATPVAAPTAAVPAGGRDTPASGVYYEIFVRSWYDTDGDGVGDLNGVTAKLDYLKSLGVSGIWLMPINPSPSYHGYDVTDYEAINPQYGSMADFERLLAEAHKRGIKVIIDLVINHTSSRHPWFVAAQDPRDPHHAWYRWAGPDTDLSARSAAGDTAWQTLPDGRHYLGIFSRGMPDLDYDHPAVRQAMVGIGQFWLRKGVDGFRLDAARHIYLDFKSQEGDRTILARNLAWWGQFMRGVHAVKPEAYVIGEVTDDRWQQLAPWYGALSAVFDFPLATRLIDAARDERAGDLGDLLQQRYAGFAAAAGKPGSNAPFLSNHDQNRVMSQLGADAAHMRTAAAMLLTLPGHPFVYYGEELGMRAVKPDPDLREPMRWERSPRAAGETRWKQPTARDGAEVSVQAELADPGSLLARYLMLIHWREQIPALRDGTLSAFASGNPHVAGWRLRDDRSRVLVLHNLSGQAQTLALGEHAPAFSTIARQTGPGATLAGSRLVLPPYTSVILQ
ncbi:alpha-amylase family glycosyl hydrolase [Dyella sp.]|uniref:alpha-amylase family glycosyl hydrolase n=1 Tax=Dyella sp. TaxID=1869338 RepID=UPI002D78003B|nr:alpha-amylase family glycosyl hydrolase [Dyella sp.]HET6433668.1 alpha-amylase family glycosyl hydrolase [Dyella sp.]